MTGPVTDAALEVIQQAHDRGEVPIWDLREVERAHLRAQPEMTIEVTPKRGTLAVDREGDTWRYGTTRWTCLTRVNGVRIRSVARLPHSEVVHRYGPLRSVGDRNGYRYRTIGGREI